MPDLLSPLTAVDSLQLRICQLFALRPTLGTLGVTQIQLDADPESVLEYYAESLVDFFCATDTTSESRWERLTQLLAQRLRRVLHKQTDPITRRMLQAVLAFPDSGERTPAFETYALGRPNDLALVIVGANKTLVYSLGFGLETFVPALPDHVLENAERLEHDVFEGWALCALEAMLQRIDAIDLSEPPRLEHLDRQLAWATRFRDFFQQDPEQETLRQQLPTWLKDACAEGRLAYSKLLAAMAGAHQKYCAPTLLDTLPDDGSAHQACFARDMALQLCRVALECSFQGRAGITLDGYNRLRVAVKTYATHRHVQGEPMVFRRLTDESGYLIGAQSDESGPWLVFRPGSTQVLQQVMTPPASGPALPKPFADLFRARQALVGSPFNVLLAADADSAWRADNGLMRSVALLLVYPVLSQSVEPVQMHPRVKRLDVSWAGARQALSALQQHRLAALRRPHRVGELIREGVHKGLHLFNSLLIYNKDENHIHVLSHNRIQPVININVSVHRLVDSPDHPEAVGPEISSNAEGIWEISRSPRFKREVEGLSVRGCKAFDAARAALTQVNREAGEAILPGTPPVEVEERFERLAQTLDNAAKVLVQFTQRLATADSAALVLQLRATAAELRVNGRRRRIDLTRRSQTPTVGDVQYLLEQQVVSISRLNGREEETIDGTVDYLQEFAVLDGLEDHRPLWYAHFHYPAPDTSQDQPSAAHLKLASQRRLGRVFEQAESGAGRSTRVYRAPISTPSGRRIFLDVL